jgi:catechol 2,3-dioxygenase-like lactoylglutathione lyase family enzyme
MLCEYHTYPTIPAADMDRARRFYEGTLGFEPAQVTPGGVMYNAKGSVLFVYPSQFAGTNKATACTFDVADLRATVRELKGRGVRFEEYDFPEMKTVDGIASFEEGSSAWFKDTEGNIIALAQLDRPIAWPRETVSAGQRA